MQAQRTAWRAKGLGQKLDQIVFLDESGVNIDLSRLYGRSIGRKRVVDHVPLNTPKRLTILGSMRWDGSIAYTTYQGGTTAEQFVRYLKDVLLPTLRAGDIVVMDNMRSHHVKEVAETLQNAGISLLYLPPYSPDLNPIEMLWSKLKSILRKWAIPCATQLHDAVSRALKFIMPLDCQHWFAADGYCS